MKYVILNASPRPNSNISQMLGIVRNELLACGDRVLYVDVCKLQFRPCIGCMKCVKSCPAEAISIDNNLARIDYSKCIHCGTCDDVCVTGCITEADFRGLFNKGKEA